jgi:oligopeptide/dipeptide ABC transporter ATP-binding protein
MTEELLRVEGLSISFAAHAGNAAVDAVELQLDKGELVALVGESGSGKSLLAHALAGILTSAATARVGRYVFAGIDLSDPASRNWRDVRGREIGIVFQNPRAALNPVRRIGRQLADAIAEHRLLKGRALDSAVLDALAAVRIPDPARRRDAYAGELSGGMAQRTMIAIALAGDPSLLIADEPTTGLDTTTQAAIIALIKEQATSRGMACLFITHDLALARQTASRILVMHAGQIVEDAAADRLFTVPRHPYAAALVRTTPSAAVTIGELGGIPGRFPDLGGVLSACRFADRCDRVQERCRYDRPALAGPAGARVACWYPMP